MKTGLKFKKCSSNLFINMNITNSQNQIKQKPTKASVNPLGIEAFAAFVRIPTITPPVLSSRLFRRACIQSHTASGTTRHQCASQRNYICMYLRTDMQHVYLWHVVFHVQWTYFNDFTYGSISVFMHHATLVQTHEYVLP